MKRLLLPIILLIGCARTDSGKEILGQWTVNDRFYHATYEILRNPDGLTVEVVNYNDGTTRYRRQDSSVWVLAQELMQENDEWVDGISGATKGSSSKELALRIRNTDTLEVTTWISGQSLNELWIRKNETP